MTNEFLPWLMGEMSSQLDMVTVARSIADELLAAAGARKAQMIEEMKVLQAAADARAAAERASAAKLAAASEAQTAYEKELADAAAAADVTDPPEE